MREQAGIIDLAVAAAGVAVGAALCAHVDWFVVLAVAVTVAIWFLALDFLTAKS